MSQYYLHDGQNQSGPYSFEQLKNQSITPKTNVWKEGIPTWVKAGELEELRELWQSVPTPYTNTSYSSEPRFAETFSQQKRQNWIIYLVAVFIVLACASFIYWYSQDKQPNPKPDNKAYEETPASFQKTIEQVQQDLVSLERSDPAKYLDVLKPTWRKNLLNETVLEGAITCNSKIARFKDAVLEVSYYTGSNTLLGREKFIRYEIWGPGSEVTFKYKTNAPRDTRQIRFQIVGATVTD